MAAETTSVQEKRQGDVALPLIRKLTTEKAVKAHRQQTKEKAATADEITNIKLSGRGIKTIESFDLPSLRRLDLSKNNLNRLKGLQSCPEVTYLTAAGNELTGEGLDGVRPLRDLKVFNASGNRVRRIPPTVFAQFRQLQALVLNNNEITEVPPTWFKKGLLTLNTLVLSHNKVKSLSDTGLGRLTALTKISVSHNELCELPDLSACSGLEELRAAHNLISEVPSSLGKNVALRTLDLGHNTIEGWGGLERVGKTLASLVQITLAGNPICTNAPSGTEASIAGGEDGGDEGAAARGGEGEYVAKVRSLFPSLKVRDGKRILMKKSHTYYEQRAADAKANADAGATGGFPAPSEGGKKFGRGGGRPGKGSGDGFGGGDGREGDGQKPTRRLMGKPAAAPAAGAAAVVGKDEKKSGNDRTSSGDTEKARRREARRLLKKEAARADAGGAEGARIKGDGAAGAAGATDLPGSDKRSRLPKDEQEDPAGIGSKKKKRRREARDSPETAAAAASEDRNPRRDSETAVGEPIASSAQDKKQRTKKKIKAKASAEAPTGGGGRAANKNSGSRGGGGDGGDKDPYSSSEELPVPGKLAGKRAGGDVKGGAGGGAKSAAQGGDRESGVVSVVLNRKRKGAKGSKGKAWQAAGEGGGLQRDDAETGGGGEEGGFSVEGMLAARGQRETVGLGSGVSAWG